MRSLFVVALVLTAVSLLPAQTAPPAASALPKDPAGLMDLAAPLYDFNAANLAPWHMKATYQIYDEKGQPSTEGTYEYWWLSPQTNRSTWARAHASYTEWHTSEGHSHLITGGPLQYFEYKLQSALISPLPSANELDPSKVRLERQEVGVGGGHKLPCVMVQPKMPLHSPMQTAPMGIFPTYCFDPNLPALRVSYSFGTLTTEYDHIARLNSGQYLARQIQMFDGKRKILTAQVDAVTGLDPADPALKPAPGASEPQLFKSVDISAGIAAGMILKKQVPAYPEDAKAARVSGAVVLQAVIGTDGAIRDLHVVSAPASSLAASALWAVSHWQYRPYLFNGEPVEVHTTINVIFSFGA
jgi:TonB family protein